MHEIEQTDELASVVGSARCAGLSHGFVPTMGCLHAGHLKLIDTSRKENDVTVLSVYVNPSQFGPSEDLGRYPRDIVRDRALAESAGVDILFRPSDAVMYPDGLQGQSVWVDPGDLGTGMEGEFRPGHFRGVATVVAKLLEMVRPDRMYLGQKDAQQAVVLSRMVRDLALAVTVRVIPTVREPDGLALSSRNIYLSTEERLEAAALNRGLEEAEHQYANGGRDAGHLTQIVREVLARDAPGGRIDYIAVVDAKTLKPVVGEVQGATLICLAVWFGSTRLIDNVSLAAE
jgi:pantoate--beta-alanine ligase